MTGGLHRPVDPLAVPAPAEIGWITRVIGAAAAFRLIETFGGTRIRVPRKVVASGNLAKAIGQTEALAMAREWGGHEIKVPVVKFWRVRLYHQAGMTYGEIARRLGCTESAVGKQLARAKLTNRQRDQAELPL